LIQNPVIKVAKITPAQMPNLKTFENSSSEREEVEFSYILYITSMEVNTKVVRAPENIKTKIDLRENSTAKMVLLTISRRF
jgi:hypothetical protein